MTFDREQYLVRLIAAKGDGFVKIVTGIRRCGKSYLIFTLFKEHLLTSGVKASHIVEIALDSDEFEELRDPRKLSSYVRAKVKRLRGPCYVLIDEIQMCEEVKSIVDGSSSLITFYDVLNGLMKLPGVDLYITGSNSKMLSDEVATNFRDRGEIIRLYPLLFSEFFKASGLSEYQAWNRYLVYGGMPEAVLKPSDAARRDYLSGLFKTLYFKDIVEHNNLKDDYVLGLLTDVLLSSTGSLTNPTRIANTLSTEQGVRPDVHTVQQYLKFLSEAYLFSKVERYDVKGRRYLQYPSKWYVEDVGLRNARLNYRQTERTHLMENVIYNELVARGCSVDVGVVEAKVPGENGKRELRQYEIDFVVNTGFEKLYIQSALEIQDGGKLSQETFSLRKARDSFRKLVVVGGDQPFYTDDEGISFVGIIPFLLDKTILSAALAEMH